jgi:hypothetical protein
MSTVIAALRRTGVVVRPAMRGRRAIAATAAALLVVAGLLVAHYHPAGLFGGSGAQASATGTGSGGGAAGSAGNGGSGNNGSGSNGAAAAANGQGANGANAKSGAHTSTSPTPAHTPVATPTPTNTIYGKADVVQSNCADGYEAGQQCSVYYHGVYDLISQAAGKVVFEVVIDGVNANSQTYAAPAGAHRFGGALKFTIPPHAKKVVYDCLLEDASGKVLTQSAPQTTYGYG